MKRAMVLLVVATIAACGQAAKTEQDARQLADAEMKQHCASGMTNCDGLRFTSISKNDGRWLVEYESKDYLYGAIVNEDGAVEITFTNEK
jgi:hypothetical protein